ncbi:MAG: DUF2490 domain-containing protein [Bacteroidetes bacterium]|nr:DUF2490 domain-containing protein [Bacteroidota bacterium]
MKQQPSLSAFFRVLVLVGLAVSLNAPAAVAGPDQEDQLGAWYMAFWTASIPSSSFGFQGDVQYRNWNIAGDLEQLLLRGGATYSPKNSKARITLGYAFISTGAYGESSASFSEHRIYQEGWLPQQVGARLYLQHRFRYEQRWVDDQDFRTRYRYALFANLPLNQKDLKSGAIYLAFYDEIFLNGQRSIGDGREVEIFDRNRLYGGLGYSISDHIRVQAGYMEQATDQISKGQLQASAHLAW